MFVTTSKTPRAQQAQQKAREARQIFESIRQDAKLSPEGRRDALAREWADRVKEIRSLGEVEAAGKSQRREALHQELFGNSGWASGSDIISQRDAADRASRLETEAEAQRLMTAARRNGDTALMKAIAEHSFGKCWTKTLEQWADGDTRVEDKVNELYTLSAVQSNTSQVAEAMSHGLTFNLDKPAEIAGLSDSDIAAISEGVTA